MARKAKRLLALLLALIMCVSLLPAAALAEGEEETAGTIRLADAPDGESGAIAPAEEPEALAAADGTEEVIASGTCEDGLTWTLYDSGELVISGTGAMKDYKEYDPDHESTYDQVAPWIHYIDRVTSLTVESGITKIGAHAFNGTAINVPSESTLESVFLPETLTSIGSYAFMGSMFREIVFPSSLQSINYRAFSGCHELTEVFFRGSAPTFGTEAFRGDDITAYYPANDDTWTEEVRQNYGGTITWTAYSPSAVVDSGECGDDLSWTLTDDYTLTITGTGDMWDFPWNVETQTGDTPWAEYTTQICRLVVEEGVTSIGREAFEPCSSLNDVELPDTLIRLGSYCFAGAAFSKISLPASLETIEYGAFLGCQNLKDVYYGGTIDQWRQITISGDNTWLKRATIHCTDGDIDNSNKCGDDLTWSFDEETGTLTITGVGDMWSSPMPWDELKSQITRVELPEGLTRIGDSAFENCTALTGVEFPASVTEIGGGAFFRCIALTDVVLPSGINRIQYYSFCYCESLTSITIPASVTEIEYWAFGDCNGLKEITFEGNAPGISEEAFNGVTATANYPSNYPGWTEDVLQGYGGSITWIPYEKEVAVMASGQCGDDLTWTLTDDYTLTITGTGPMWNYGWDPETENPDTPWVDHVREVRRLVVTEGVTSIGWEAFDSCPSLTEVELPETLVDLEGYCFQGGAFTQIYLPAALRIIKYGAFLDCRNLTDVNYGGTKAQWGQITIESDNSWLQRATIHCTDGDIDNSDKCGDDLTWRFDEESGTLTITGSGEMWNAPTPWDGVKAQITRVELPEGLTRIGDWAFQDCTALTGVEFPASVTEIGGGAFSGCIALTDVVLPSGISRIPYYTFSNCGSLTSITIPVSVTEIEYWAFVDCYSLKEINFEGNAPGISEEAFNGVTATAYYPSNYKGWTEDVLQNYGGSITWVPYEKEVADLASGRCGDDLTWTLTDDGVLTISGTGDMYNYEWSGTPWNSYRSMITTALLPDGLAGIGDCAFTNCSSLTDIEIPAGVTYIGYSAFFSCQKLPSVTIPAGVTMIHSDTFAYCSALTSITIPASVAEIEPYAFNGSGLTEITFEGGAPTIWENVFMDVTATANYPSNYPGWTEDVLQDYGGSITWVPYEKEVAVLDEGKCGDKLTWKLMDDGTMTISGTGDMWDFGPGTGKAAPWARYTAGIYCLVVEEGVTGIGNEAFYACDRLAEVELPATLVSVGDYAFDACGALTDVVYGGTIAQWEQIAIGTYNDPLTRAAIHCTDGDVDNSGKCGRDLTWSLDENGTLTVTGTGEMWDYYNKEAPWDEQLDQIRKIVLEPGVTSVSRSAFWGCPNLTEIVLPEGLTYLGQFCFRECPGLVTVDLPASLETMDQGEFSECPNLIAVNAAPGGNYKTVGGVLFTADMKTLVIYPNGLNGVNGVYQVPDGVTTLGPRAFYGSAKLTEIKLPASVVEFGYNEFQRCYKLEAVNIPDGVQMLCVSTFYDCTSLKSLTIPASVTYITDYSFCNCTSLEEIRFEGSAPEIEWWGDGTGLFQNVTATAYYPGDDASWTAQVRNSLGQGGDITWVPYEPLHDNPFTDVKEGKYYYEPVLWAYYHDPQITGGISDTEFGPSKTCTREQIVTFLWKAMGAPEPETTVNPFEDVKSTKYYYKPVLWAVENGITGGMDATHFGVGKPCTREQAMTFLWKAMGAPEPTTTENPFEDVPSTKYYYKPVLWAVENGITGGVDATHFGVGKPCTRGQIVTFLYKAMTD